MGRFSINTVVENGQLHYNITDNQNGSETTCDLNELNETLYELMEV